MMEKINEVLKKIPIIPIFLLYCGWVAYDYYDWMNSPQSPLGLKRAALVTKKKEVEDTKKKALAGEEFYRNLDLLRSRIRELTAQLENTKTVLSADVDIANFVSMITHEAKKLRITLKEIKPEASRKKEFYEEVPFTVNLRGAYVQMLILFDRIS